MNTAPVPNFPLVSIDLWGVVQSYFIQVSLPSCMPFSFVHLYQSVDSHTFDVLIIVFSNILANRVTFSIPFFFFYRGA